MGDFLAGFFLGAAFLAGAFLAMVFLGPAGFLAAGFFLVAGFFLAAPGLVDFLTVCSGWRVKVGVRRGGREGTGASAGLRAG